MNVVCGNNQYPLDEVIEKYIGTLYRLAIIRMQNKEDAEEVVQDTFLKLIEHVNKNRRSKSILTLYWNRNTEGMDGLKDLAATTVEDNYAYDYVLRLPEKYRVAINLFYYEQLTTEQIAGIMRTKEATVRSYLHRGREKLKILMEADNNVE